MPLFVLISGYFSNHIKCQRLKDVSTLLYPYMIFQILNVLYIRYVEGGSADWNLFIPHHQNWYLISLFIWRLIIPYFRGAQPIIGLCIAILLSVLFSKYSIPNNIFALSYMFVFLPFFVFGYYAKDIINKLSFSKWKLYTAIAIICFLLLFVYIVTIKRIDLGIRFALALRPPYVCVGFFAFMLRYLGFSMAIIISVCLIYIAKYIDSLKGDNVIVGRNTMLIYLMHFFIIIPFWNILPNLDNRLSLAICILLSFLICWVFSQKRLIMFFQWMLDFNFIKEKYNCFLTKKEGQKIE